MLSSSIGMLLAMIVVWFVIDNARNYRQFCRIFNEAMCKSAPTDPEKETKLRARIEYMENNPDKAKLFAEQAGLTSPVWRQ